MVDELNISLTYWFLCIEWTSILKTGERNPKKIWKWFYWKYSDQMSCEIRKERFIKSLAHLEVSPLVPNSKVLVVSSRRNPVVVNQIFNDLLEEGSKKEATLVRSSFFRLFLSLPTTWPKDIADTETVEYVFPTGLWMSNQTLISEHSRIDFSEPFCSVASKKRRNIPRVPGLGWWELQDVSPDVLN